MEIADVLKTYASFRALILQDSLRKRTLNPVRLVHLFCRIHQDVVAFLLFADVSLQLGSIF